MTGSESNIMAILLGLGVFAVIVAMGWRSVQNRRILRLQDANGKETIIVAREDDEISSVVTSTTETSQPAPAPAPSVVVVNTGVADAATAPDFGRKAADGETAIDVEADVSGRDRLSRMVASTK
jgi:hypothetical protein